MKQYSTFHSHPSSLDSASTPEAFLKREIELGSGSMTVTDHGTLMACRKVYDLCRKANIIPILGIEGYLRDDQDPILKAAGVELDAKGTYQNYWKYGHVTMHARNQASYETMVRVLSRADLTRSERHGSERKPLFDWKDLEEICAGDVTLGSGCLIGVVQRHLLDHGDPDIATAYYERLRSLAPGRFFVELFPHVCDRNWVQGVFLTFGDGSRQKFWFEKKLKTDIGEVTAEQLAHEFNLKSNKHKQLLAIKNYHTWTEQEPRQLMAVERTEGFLQNECRPWAPDGDVQRGCNAFMMRLANRYGDPVVISDDSHFAFPEDKPIQDARLMSHGGTWRFWGSYHRQSSEEAAAYFKEKLGVGESTFESWVENSLQWADGFKNFRFHYAPSLPTKFYPDDTLLHTKRLIDRHGRMRWQDARYVDRLQRELQLLHSNGSIDLLPYFMVCEETRSLYEHQGLMTGPGRGSAAGLLLAYLLNITHVDPLEFDLSLDRFITLDRIQSGKLPDIDADFPNRDLLVNPEDPNLGWLKERFGDHVAQISVSTTLKLKSAVKDACRASERLGNRVPPEVEKLTHRFEAAPQGVEEYKFVFGYETPEGAVQGSIERDAALKEFIQKYPQEWEIAQKFLGLGRQLGRHACGFVVANRPISEFIPMTEVGGVPVTQYTADSVEACGGIKMDLLVVNSLNDISACIKLIQQRSGLQVPDSMTLNDIKVPGLRLIPQNGIWLDVWRLWVSPWAYEVFVDVSEGRTETVFQFCTPSAQQWLRKFNYLKPDGRKLIDSIDAMAVFTALDRPGPLDVSLRTEDGKTVNALEEYARRARGLVPTQDIPEVFNDLFPETYGTMCYQEQVERMYRDLTSCSVAEAEQFRSNIAKKKMEKVLAVYPTFMEKATLKVGEQNAQKIWDATCTFAQYGFNKSHATCYAIIGYVSAYLKHHFPLEWWTSVLCNADKNEVNEKFWRHCGHLIDMPDVALSGENFEIRGHRIQAPISLLHGVGEGAHAELCAGRPYGDIQDFCHKIQQHKTRTSKPSPKTGKMRLGTSALNRGVVYSLIMSGAMDSLFPRTMQLSDGTERAMTAIDQLQMYEQALAVATGAKRPETVPERYSNVNGMVRYQLRKSILPAYSEPLALRFLEWNVPNVQKTGPRMEFVESGEEPRPFVSADDVHRIEALRPWPNEDVKVVVAAYVQDVRRFGWGAGKEACEMQLDVDGEKFKFVRWGNREGKLAAKWGPELKGALVVASLDKRKEDKPFCIDDMKIVQQPLAIKEAKVEESP